MNPPTKDVAKKNTKGAASMEKKIGKNRGKMADVAAKARASGITDVSTPPPMDPAATLTLHECETLAPRVMRRSRMPARPMHSSNTNSKF